MSAESFDESHRLTREDMERIVVGFDGSHSVDPTVVYFSTAGGNPPFPRRPNDHFTVSDQYRLFYGNRWVTDPDEQPRVRGGLIRAGRTSEPDGTVVHIVTTL